MRFLTLRTIAFACALASITFAFPGHARAESLACLVSRGNLCFHTGCNNAGKSQRISFDFAMGSYRLCPNRFNDSGCTEAPMQFDIRDNVIIGTTLQSQEISARSMFVNRVTGAFTTSVLTAGGVAAVDFGTCEIRR
ncbi:hypothetical protein [Aestuariivirga sp.]|uniref:hypothetical protein n=1 Tax=Aestuariivirga sp. TaxID=2650926 RepID=UPI00391A60D1